MGSDTAQDTTRHNLMPLNYVIITHFQKSWQAIHESCCTGQEYAALVLFLLCYLSIFSCATIVWMGVNRSMRRDIRVDLLNLSVYFYLFSFSRCKTYKGDLNVTILAINTFVRGFICNDIYFTPAVVISKINGHHFLVYIGFCSSSCSCSCCQNGIPSAGCLSCKFWLFRFCFLHSRFAG